MKKLNQPLKRKPIRARLLISLTVIAIFVLALICGWTAIYINDINEQMQTSLSTRMRRNGTDFYNAVSKIEKKLISQDKYDYPKQLMVDHEENILPYLTGYLAYTKESDNLAKVSVIFDKNDDSRYLGFSDIDSTNDPGCNLSPDRFYNTESFKTTIKSNISDEENVQVFTFKSLDSTTFICVAKNLYKDGYYATLAYCYEVFTFCGELFSATLNLYPHVLSVNGDIISETLNATDLIKKFDIAENDLILGKTVQTKIYPPKFDRVLVSGGFITEYSNMAISYHMLPSETSYAIRSSYILWYALVATSCLVLLLLVSAKILYKEIMIPLSKLNNEMKILSCGKFGVTVDKKINNEVGDIIDGFNEMSLNLEKYVELNYKQELCSKDAKLKALQSVINPHFLYNTLDLINWKARKLGDDDIPKMIVNLAKLFESSMDRGNERVIELSEELELLKFYLNILDVRFGGKLKVHFNIESGTEYKYVPKLILQPIVENAVVHGVEKNREGNIWITSKTNAHGDLFIEVENDGEKIPKDKEKQISKSIETSNDYLKGSGRIGFMNVHSRIKIICGNDYGLSIFNTQKGVKVVMKLRANVCPEEVITVSPVLEQTTLDPSTLG